MTQTCIKYKRVNNIQIAQKFLKSSLQNLLPPKSFQYLVLGIQKMSTLTLTKTKTRLLLYPHQTTRMNQHQYSIVQPSKQPTADSLITFFLPPTEQGKENCSSNITYSELYGTRLQQTITSLSPACSNSRFAFNLSLLHCQNLHFRFIA